MADTTEFEAQWSDLQPELVEAIGKRLETEIDVLRFRAVCTKWRSSRTPLKKWPCGNVRLPYPFSPSPGALTKSDSAFFTLVERVVYRIERPDNTERPKFWVVKVERLSDGKFRMFNPASHHQILAGEMMPRVVNTLDYRVTEVCKAYALECVDFSSNFREDGEYRHAYKKVVYRKGHENDEYSVMAIDEDNKLWYVKSGDERWTLVLSSNGMNCRHCKYVDVVNLKGQFYAIDDWGNVWGFNSRFEWTVFVYSELHCSSERHLVESYDGNLHLVEAITGENICCSSGGVNRLTSYIVSEAALGIRIWILSRRDGQWGQPHPLNGPIMFTGDDCSFCLPSEEFDGSNGYRVFYTNKCISFQTQDETNNPRLYDAECNCCSTCQNVVRVYQSFDPSDDVKLKFRGLHGHNTGVSDFRTGKTGSLLLYHEYADIFWPPPSWLTRP